MDYTFSPQYFLFFLFLFSSLTFAGPGGKACFMVWISQHFKCKHFIIEHKRKLNLDYIYIKWMKLHSCSVQTVSDRQENGRLSHGISCLCTDSINYRILGNWPDLIPFVQKNIVKNKMALRSDRSKRKNYPVNVSENRAYKFCIHQT